MTGVQTCALPIFDTVCSFLVVTSFNFVLTYFVVSAYLDRLCEFLFRTRGVNLSVFRGSFRRKVGLAVLFVAFAETQHFRLVLYSLVGLTGILVGVELPLLLRLLRERLAFADLIAQVLSLDYIGALAASLLFPLLLVPQIGRAHV